MAKEYFSHDYNARHDRKIAALVKEYKAAGYGIFWATCEMMHEEGDRLEFDDITFCSISKDLNEDEGLVKEVLEKCIAKYKLFVKQDILLTSNRVKKNLNGSAERKAAKAEAGRLGGINSGLSRKLKQNEALLQADEADLEANEAKKRKEKKSNESKEINKWDVRPKKNCLNGLPDDYRRSAKESLKISQNTIASKDQIEGLWEIFKTQNLTGTNYYATEDKVYSHFLNWVKTQKVAEIKEVKKGGIHL